jgi:SPP1 gp7 family putative phage head morphogenesis protein
MATEKKPIGPELIARVTGAYRALKGDAVWFGPLQPLPPMVPEVQEESVRGRQFDFPVGANTRLTPRGTELTSFAQMRALADGCDILRLVIETRKDQLSKLKWNIVPIDGKKQPDSRCEEVQTFFRLPDGENNWQDWIRQLLEEMFVTDAAAIYPWMKKGGKPHKFDLLDGATIKRVIDNLGRTPVAPQPAYQQVLKGIVAVGYTADELVYAPRNKRVHKVYGYSPVEQIIMTVNIAMRRALHQLQYYTEGSTPDLLMQVPENWQMAQIKEFNDWWNDMLSGNTGTRRKAQFVPHGVTPLNTKEAILKDPYDEWLARVICYAFSVSSQAFIKENNRSTSETAHQMALEEGLHPVMLWVKGVLDKLIWKYFGYTDLEFKWEEKEATNELDQSTIDDRNVKNGTATINEVRTRRGDAPVDGGDAAMVLTASGYVPITPKEPEPVPAPLAAQAGEQPADGEEDPEPTPPKGGGKAPGEAPSAAKGEGKVGAGVAKAEGAYKRLSPKAPAPIKRDTAKAEARLGAAVHKQLTTQLGRLLEALDIEKVQKDVEGVDVDGIEWSGWQEFNDLFGKQLAITAKNGVAQAYTQLKLQAEDMLTLANAGAVEWAKERAAELVGKRFDTNGELVDNPNPKYSIENSTREFIRADVTSAMVEGWSNDKLAKALAENYAFSEERAITIARTETATADTAGNMKLYQQTGVVAKKQWIVGAECCPICEEIDGEVVKLDDEFSSGTQAPPAHPNCRCDFLPILPDLQDD